MDKSVLNVVGQRPAQGTETTASPSCLAPRQPAGQAAAGAQGATSAEQIAVVMGQLRRVFHAARVAPRSPVATGGLSSAQRRALLIVRAQPGICISALARVMGVRQPTTSALVKGMAARKLLAARRCTRDRRMFRLHLLPTGCSRLDQPRLPDALPLASALASLEGPAIAHLELAMAALLLRLEAVAPTSPSTSTPPMQ